MVSSLYWASKWREVIAADSRKKILERRDKVLNETHVCGDQDGVRGGESEGHGDNTEIIHTYDDGSTIRKLHTYDDHAFESDMQGNCVRDHAHSGNIHSLRDKDNIPILSFAMDTTTKGRCNRCDGQGEEYIDGDYDEDTGEQIRGGYYEHCEGCNGSGRMPSGASDGIVRLHSILRKENGHPRDHELLKLVDGIRDKYKPEDYHSVNLGGSSRGASFEDIDAAREKAATAEDRLPKGDVYLKVPEDNFDVDDEGTTHDHGPGTLHPHGETTYGYNHERTQMSETDPGPSPGHYVVKTPYTPRRFKHTTGLIDYIENGVEMPEKPTVSLDEKAVFPKNTYNVVHKPDRPTKVWITTAPNARNNPEHYTPEGLNPSMIEGNVFTREPGKIVSPGPHEEKPMATSGQDVWEVNFKDEDESRKFLRSHGNGGNLLHVSKTKLSKCDTCKGEGRVPATSTAGHQIFDMCDDCKGKGETESANTIPWDRVKLHKPADDRHGTLHPMPTMVANEDGSVGIKVHEPETLYMKHNLIGESKRTGTGDHSWQALHDLENSHLSEKDWGQTFGYNDGLTSIRPRETSSYEHHEVPSTISIPNDPKYVEPIPKADRRDGNKDRQWRIKPGVSIPRDQYSITNVTGHDVTPQEGYLHIPHMHRDNDKVFTSEGIDTAQLMGNRTGYGRADADEYKITTEPNEGGPSAHRPHHVFSPSQSDIFKIDLSKLPDWGVKSVRSNPAYGEDSHSKEFVTRITPPTHGKTRVLPCGKECQEMAAKGSTLHADSVNGEELEPHRVKLTGQPGAVAPATPGTHTVTMPMNKVIPWDAVIGLHSKAEVPGNEEYRKRFASIARLQASAWGDVRGRKVST